MKRVARILSLVAVAFLSLIAVGIAGLLVLSEQRLGHVYTLSPEVVPIPSDSDSISHGQVIAQSLCVSCHGADLSGGETYSLGLRGTATAGNLTTGNGGAGMSYSDEDWVRAIRYAVGPDNKALILMPSDRFAGLLNDSDLGALISYLKSLPAVDNNAAQTDISLVGRIDYLTGQWPTLIAVDLIDLDSRPPVIVAARAEIVDQLVACQECHGAGLSGDGEEAIDIMGDSQTGIGSWTEKDFARFMRENVRPGESSAGRFTTHTDLVGELSDEQIRLLWEFLQSLPVGNSPAAR